MLINERCTVCHEDVGPSESVPCGECGGIVHEPCAEFERSFTCRDCADEPEIGAVEF